MPSLRGMEQNIANLQVTQIFIILITETMDMTQMKTMMILMMTDNILYINKAVNTCTEFM